MKLTAILLIATCLQVSADGHSQNVTLSEKNAPLKKVFIEIRKQTGYTFFCNESLFENTGMVTVKLKNAPLQWALDICLKEQDLTYTIVGNNIVIKEKEKIIAPAIITAPAPIPFIDFKGRVVNEQGEPLAGASVTIKGTDIGTITDANGNFSINAEINATLVISYVGHTAIEVVARKQDLGRFTLKLSETSISEQVVVIGYGQVKRKDLTGSVSSVKATDIVKSTDMSLNQALQGRAAGVQVTSAEGGPGAAVTISIRAGSSISASNDPLYIIDGFPQFGGSNLNINVNDIASIEILKDASATAIYGSRGANGVIIITTKSGKAGKFSVSFDSYVGFQELGVKRNLINSMEYAKMQHYFSAEDRNSGIGDTLWNNWPSFKDSASTDWQEKIFSKALMQSHNISFTGGTENLKVSGSIGYTGQNGIAVGTNYKRYTARLNTIAKIGNRVTNGTVIYLSHSKRKGSSLTGNGGITYSILKGSPYKPLDVSDLNSLLDPIGGPGGSNGLDPYLELALPKIDNLGYTASLNTYFNFKIIEDLVLKIAGGVSFNTSTSDYFYPRETAGGSSTNGAAGHSSESLLGLLNENTLTYSKTLNQNHRFELLGGFTIQTEQNKGNDVSVDDFPIQTLGYDRLNFGSRLYTPSSYRENSGLVSYLGRVNYNFLDKYYLTASIRADGSSKFHQEQWGYFPSGAFAWKLSDEKFMSAVNAISTLKLRASWGMTGNESVPPYSSYSTYDAANPAGYPPIINERVVVGLVPAQLGTTDLIWETTIQSNVGLDLGLLRDRITLTVDAYKKKSKDLLLRAPLASYSGFAVTNGSTPRPAFVFRNIGDIQVKGLEINLNTINLTGKFKWNTNFNIAFNRSKVLALNEGQTSFTIGTVARFNTPYIVEVGKPLGSFYGYVYDGLFNTQEEFVSGPTHQSIDAAVGTRRYKDIDGDGDVDTDDRTVIGNGNPKFFGGFNNEFRYGPLELSALFTFSYGNDLLNAQKALIELPYPYQGGLTSALDHWTPDNPQVNKMRWYGTVNTQYMNEYDNSSSYLIEDGSYLRLKNILIAYNFSPSVTKKLKLQGLRVYVSGQNLLTFTRYTGYDPEVDYLKSIVTPGADLGAYPRSKIYTFGLNVNF